MIFDSLGVGMGGKVAFSLAKSTLISEFLTERNVRSRLLYSNTFSELCMITSPVLTVQTSKVI